MKTTIKSFEIKSDLSTGFNKPNDEELALINSKIDKVLTADEVRVFTVYMCNSDLDKSNETMSKAFLEQFADYAEANRLPGQLDHVETVKDTWANVFKAWVEEKDGTIYAVARAYSIYEKNKDILESIESGVIGNVSVSFNGDGHPEQTAEGTNIFVWDTCSCAREFSLVTCPCQDKAFITKSLSNSPEPTKTDEDKTKNNTGGKKMKALDIFTKAFKKSLKEDDSDNTLLDLLENPDRELSEEELKLREQVEELQAKLEEQKQQYEARISELEEQLKACGAKQEEMEAQTIEDKIDEEIDKMNPLTPVVKECIKKELNRENIKFVEGKLEGLSEQLEAAKTKFAGLFKETKTITNPVVKTAPFSASTQKVDTRNKLSFNEACKRSFK